MYIQYTGFEVSRNSRIYNFRVLGLNREPRAFTVDIQSDTNHWATLKLQDGPGICFERLEQELGRETPASCAELNLHISAQDICKYLARHYPAVKAIAGKDTLGLPAGPLHPPGLAASSVPDRGLASHRSQYTDPLA
jgi:hypothetical protein